MEHAFTAGVIFGVVVLVFVVLGLLLRAVDEDSEGPVVIVGTALAVVGFFIPWYWVSFSPPHGSTIVNGGVMKASTFTESGLSVWSSSGGKLLWLGIFASVPIALSYLLPSIARGPKKVLHAVAHLMVSLSLLAFVWLTLAFWNSGFRADFVNQAGRTQSALDASQYVSGHIGVGLFLLTLGVIIVSVVLIKEILALIGLVILVTIGLAIFYRPGLGSFYHVLDFSKGKYF